MKHKIKFINYSNHDEYGSRIEIDDSKLFCDAENTYNCIEEILEALDVDYEIEFLDEYEKTSFITRKMKLVEGDA
jgi:hypothetical protein